MNPFHLILAILAVAPVAYWLAQLDAAGSRLRLVRSERGSTKLKDNLPTAESLRSRFFRDGEVPPTDVSTALVAIKQARQAHLEAMRSMLDAAEAAGRDFLASEQREYNRHESEARHLDLLSEEVALYRVEWDPIVNPRTPTRRAGDPVLAREQRMADWARARGYVDEDAEHLSFRKWLRGVVTGDWHDADAERRAMSVGTLGSGGYLVPTPLSTRIIDRARNAARVLQAGAVTVPMETSTLKVARVAGDPTAAWHTENAAITPSDMTLEQVTLTARTLPSLVQASRELIEDAEGVEDALETAFAAQLALTLDLAALYGSGTAPEPRGVKNTTGVTTQSQGANGAALANYDPFVDAIGTLWDNNEDATGIIYAPRTARAVAKLKDSTNQPLRPPEVVEAVPRYQTNQVPTNLTQGTANNASDAFVADWRQLLIGVRQDFAIEVLRERYADNYQLGFLAHLRADVAVARPKAFVVITGIIP